MSEWRINEWRNKTPIRVDSTKGGADRKEVQRLPIRVKSQQLEAKTERKKVNPVVTLKALCWEENQTRFCSDEHQRAQTRLQVECCRAESMEGAYSERFVWRVWPVIRESWGGERELLRTNEDEERGRKKEGVDVETRAIRDSSGQQSYSRLTAPAALTLGSSLGQSFLWAPWKEDMFDGGQLSTSEKIASDPKTKLMKIHWWRLSGVFGISDMADDLVRGALVETRADIIQIIWIEERLAAELWSSKQAGVRRGLLAVCVGGRKTQTAIQRGDLMCASVYACDQSESAQPLERDATV